MIGKALVVWLLCVGVAQAGLESELKQQLEIEARLQAELEMQKQSSTQAYVNALELVDGAVMNREEQLHRLEAAYYIWDEFIEKVCLAKVLESVGTRAENANNLQCMIEKYKKKEEFFESLI